MNKSNRALLVITVVMAVVLIGSWALAGGQWGKRGHPYAGSGPGCDLNLSPETEEKLRSTIPPNTAIKKLPNFSSRMSPGQKA